MIVNKTNKIKLFEEFYSWLKDDGLSARKSERLHKKKIFSALLSDDEMTVENFNDFLKDRYKRQIKAIKGLLLKMNGKVSFIQDIVTEDEYETFTIITEKAHIKCKKDDIEQIQKQLVEGD